VRNPAAESSSSSVLVPVIQMLLSARTLEDVRGAIAHGARLICHYDALTLYEVEASATLTATLHHGMELGAGAAVLEELLCGKASKTGRPVSTLDRFLSEQEQSIADDYTRRFGLCLARPLPVFGEFIGLLVFHYEGRSALADYEFEALRRFTDCAAVALSNARLRDELHNYAYSDPLTGLANRRRLELEFKRLQGSQLSLLLIDFDGLKSVNDRLGYDSGDTLINAIGAKLTECTKPDEFVVRLGGDEFVVIMPEADRTRAHERTDELTATLDQLALPENVAILFNGASVGAATADPGEDLWEVLQRASAEMRSRKRRRKTDRDLLSETNEGLRFRDDS
jgi:diguanylate cyclase (GGDEF)-like protein